MNETVNDQRPILMKQPPSKIALNLLLCGWILFLTVGCSGFHRAWKHEISRTTPYPDGTFEGAWEGEWVSETNGHHGRLRCLVNKNEDGTYRTWYHAKYKKILSFAYGVDVEVKPVQSGYEFNGEADLGKLAGGLYRYEGESSKGDFHATYSSKFDNGIFKMNRPSSDE